MGVNVMTDSGRDPDADMKSPSQQRRAQKRVAKPVMEKRRRERINHSLETLRQMMVENTGEEKMKNRKVEKAEILEGVVQYLHAEQQMKRAQQEARRPVPAEPMPNYAQQQSICDCMRACMVRVDHYMVHGANENVVRPVPFVLQGPRGPLRPPELISRPPNMVRAVLAPLHLPHHQLPGPYRPNGEMLPSPDVPEHIDEAVWRPWPK